MIAMRFSRLLIIKPYCSVVYKQFTTNSSRGRIKDVVYLIEKHTVILVH